MPFFVFLPMANLLKPMFGKRISANSSTSTVWKPIRPMRFYLQAVQASGYGRHWQGYGALPGYTARLWRGKVK